jgi:ABC-type polysaccharide/polyol phosphate transport system ATPase subunit
MLDDFSYDFNKGDRIGIVGRNGVGKVRIVIYNYALVGVDF